MKVRTGYKFQKGQRVYEPGEIVDLTTEEHNSLRQIFDPAEVVAAPKVVAPKVEAPKEEPTIENRAILDSTAGAPIIPQGKRRRR